MGRSDKDNAGFFAFTREHWVFGKEAISGMNGINIFFQSQGNDFVHVQIGGDGSCGLNHVSFVSLRAEKRHSVFFGVNGHGANAELMTGTNNADRDFTAIGHQDLFKFFSTF